MVLGFIVHYIIANSYVQKITGTPTHTSAYKQKLKDWISNVSKSNNWHIQWIAILKKYPSLIKTTYQFQNWS